MLLGFFSQAGQKSFYFIVFDADHLSKTVEFNAKKFVLIFNTFLQVLELEVEYLLKLVFELI